MIYNFELQKMDNIKKNLKNTNYYRSISIFLECLTTVSDNCSHKINIDFSNSITFESSGIDSSIETIKSLEFLLLKENYIDVYVLLRKIRDNLLLSCVILNESLNYHFNLDLNENFFDRNLSIKKINCAIKLFLKQKEEQNNSSNIKKAINYFYNKKLDEVSEESTLNSENENLIRKYINYSKYKKYFDEEFNKLEYPQNLLKNIEKKLNNFVHSNGISFFDNNRLKYTIGFKNLIDDIINILENIVKVFVIYVFSIDGTLVQSSDYIDALDAGIKPIEGCQNRISGSIKYMIEKIKNDSIETYEQLKKYNKYAMEI